MSLAACQNRISCQCFQCLAFDYTIEAYMKTDEDFKIRPLKVSKSGHRGFQNQADEDFKIRPLKVSKSGHRRFQNQANEGFKIRPLKVSKSGQRRFQNQANEGFKIRPTKLLKLSRRSLMNYATQSSEYVILDQQPCHIDFLSGSFDFYKSE